MLSFVRRRCAPCLLLVLFIFGLYACRSTVPSARIQDGNGIAVPEGEKAAVIAPTMNSLDQGTTVTLSARSLIPIAFNLHPEIKASFQRYKAEEARYDFFYTSRDTLTPTLRTSNRWGRNTVVVLDDEVVTRRRDHLIEAGVEKKFFDTTRMEVSTGVESSAFEESNGYQPFVDANVRYPLWGSREKLERASEDIFRQNELSDAKLDYIQSVRRTLQRALSDFYGFIETQKHVEASSRYLADLEALKARMRNGGGAGSQSEDERIEAELATTRADVRNAGGRYEIVKARLLSGIGLPHESQIELDPMPFNPFAEKTHEALLEEARKADPEIATLKNSLKNSEVQLDLARRGKWDIALLLGGRQYMEGHENREGMDSWSASTGMEVSLVDPRVTGSLKRQATANIARFQEAIADRERSIYVDTLEPLIRIDTLSNSRDELQQNLQRFEKDYEKGLEEYLQGALTLDDLLTRREKLYDEERRIADLASTIGYYVADLCAATGVFFELLSEKDRMPTSHPYAVPFATTLPAASMPAAIQSIAIPQ